MVPRRARRRADVWYTLLLVGLGAACAGSIAAIGVLALLFYFSLGAQAWRESVSPPFVTFVVASCLVSALLGPVLWWWAIVKVGRLSVRRGIGVGALGGILGHPLVWYTLFIEAYLTGQRTVLGIPLVTNPFMDVASALMMAIISVELAGWITVLVGAVAGGTMALLQSLSGCQERWRAALAT
jgi:hypothetical protein